ncbi:MAG: DUF1273 family protein [Clostridia bacterium]|nr:DUF1273 family protein [Clostridia bacterium]
MENKKICAIAGENPDELQFGYDEEYYGCALMKYRLVSAMQDAIASGYSEFVSTLDQGVAMWGAEACLAIKAMGTDVCLTAVPTSELQAARWHPERRERYYNLLENADRVIETRGENIGEGCLLNEARQLIVVGDPSIPRLADLIERAKSQGIAVHIV